MEIGDPGHPATSASPDQVTRPRDRSTRIGEILLLEGLVTADDIAHGLQLQAEGSEWRLGRILVRLGAIDDRTLTEAIAKQFRVRIVDPRREPPEHDVVRRLSREAALQLQALPMHPEDGRFLVAVSDPPTRDLRVAIERAMGARVRLVLCPADELTEALEYWYQFEDVELADEGAGLSRPMPDANVAVDATADSVTEPKADERRRPCDGWIVQWLLLDAFRRGASAVYLDLGGEDLRVRYRIGNQLAFGPRLQRPVGSEACRQILVAANPEMQRPGVGGGHIEVDIHGQTISVRTIVMSSASATRIGLFLAAGRLGVRRFEHLAIREGDAVRLRSILARGEGLVAIAAPTMNARQLACLTLVDEIDPRRLRVVVRRPDGVSVPDAAEIVVAADAFDAIEGVDTAVKFDADVVIVDAGSDARIMRTAFDVADRRLVVAVVESSDGADVVTGLAGDVGAIRVAGALAAVILVHDDNARLRADVHVLTDELLEVLLDEGASRDSETP